MGNHPWVSALLAAAMLAVAVYCIARLVLSFRSSGVTQRDTDAVHAVMGVSMAGMLAPLLTAAPGGLWVLVFSTSALWFGWKVLHDSNHEFVGGHPHCSHFTHLLMCAAMIYMLIVMDWTGSMHYSHGAGLLAMATAGTSASPWPLLAVVLTVLLIGDVAFNAVLNLRQLVPLPAVPFGELAMAEADEPGTARGGSSVDSNVQQGNVQLRVRQGPAHTSKVLAPRSAVVCQLVMCLVMGYMLVTRS